MDTKSIIETVSNLDLKKIQLLDYMKTNRLLTISDLQNYISEKNDDDMMKKYQEFINGKEEIDQYNFQYSVIKEEKLFQDYGISEQDVETVISLLMKKNYELIITLEDEVASSSYEKASTEIIINDPQSPECNPQTKTNFYQDNFYTQADQSYTTDEKITLDEIRNSLDEIKEIVQLPESFIKYIKYLDCQIRILLLESNNSSETKSKFNQQKNLFLEIWNKIEDYSVKNKIMNFDEVEKLIISLKEELFEKNIIDDSLNLISKIKSKVTPLDLDKLKFYYNTTIKAAEKIKEKKVVALIGNSNAGKSTSTFYLAGSQMKLTLINGKIPHIYAESHIYSELDNIKSSYKALSETRYVVAFQVNYKDLNFKKNGSIYLADLPGLFENRDIETEISNNLGVTRFLKACKTLKILYFLNYKDMVANNCQGVRDLVNIIINLVGSVDNFIDKFLFVVNKADKNEYEELKERISNLELTEAEKEDNEFVRAVKNVSRQIQKSSFLIDPLNKDELEEIHNKIEVFKEFKNPGEVFNLTLSPNAKSILRDYVNAKDKFIINALENADKPLLINQIQELSFFNEIEEMNDLQSQLKDIRDKIIKNLNNNHHLLQKIINDINSQNSIICLSQVYEIENLYLKINDLDEVRYLLSDSEVLFKLSDAKKLIEDFIKENSKVKLPEDTQFDYLFFSEVNKKLTNIYLITNRLIEYSENYTNFYKFLKEEIFNNFLEKYQEAFSVFKYEESYRYFLILKNLHIIISHFTPEFSDLKEFKYFNLELNINNKKETELSENLKAGVLFIFEESIEKICNIFLNGKDILTKEELNQLIYLIDEINKIIESPMSELFDKSKLKDSNQKIAFAAISYINKRNEIINSMIISDDKLIIDDLINDYESLKSISKIEKINIYVWDTYKKTCEILETLLINIKNSYNSSLDIIKNSIDDDLSLFSKHIKKICSSLISIEKSKLINSLDPHFKDQFNSKIKDDLNDYIEAALKKANYGNSVSLNEKYFIQTVLGIGKLSIINETEISELILNKNNLENEISNLEKKLLDFLEDQIDKIKKEDIKLNLKLFKFSFINRNFYLENLKKFTNKNFVSIIESIEQLKNDSDKQFETIIFSSIQDMLDLFSKKNFSLDSIENDRNIIKFAYESLKEIEDINNDEKFYLLFTIINKNKDYNIELIKSSLYEIKQHFFKLVQNNSINIDLNSLKNVVEVLLEQLIPFDRLNLNCEQPYTFSKLNELCYEMLKSSYPAIEIRDKDKIQSSDFIGLVESFEDIFVNRDNPINQRREREINFQLNLIIRNAKENIYSNLKLINTDFFEENHIRAIEENSKILNDIHIYLEKFIKIDEIKGIKEYTSEKLNLFNEKMNNQIIGYLKSSLFANAENILKKLFLYNTMLSNVQTKEIDFNKIRVIQNDEFEKIKNNYKSYDIMKFRIIRPKKLFDQLNRDEIISNYEIMSIYEAFQKELIDIIDEKYAHKIEEINSGDTSLNEKEEKFQALEKTTDYLPNINKDFILEQIKKEKNNLANSQKFLEESIKEYIIEKNYKKISEIYKNKWPIEFKNQVQKYLNSQAKELFEEFEFRKIDEESNYEKFIENIWKNYDFYCETRNFSDILSSWETNYKKKLIRDIKEIIKAENEFFDLDQFKLDSSKQIDDIISSENENCNYSFNSENLTINKFPKVFREIILLFNEQPIVFNRFIPELPQKIQTCFKKIMESIEQIDDINQDLLQEDIISSRFFLSVFNKVKGFHSHLRILFNEQLKEILKSNPEIQNHQLLEYILKFKSPDERRKEVEKHIDEYKYEICNFRLNIINNERSYDKFFRTLNSKIQACKIYYNNFINRNISYEIDKSIENQIDIIIKEISQLDVFTDKNLEDQILKETNLKLYVLIKISDILPDFKYSIDYSLKQFKNNIIETLNQKKETSLKGVLNLDIISDNMIEIRKLCILLKTFEKEIDYILDDFINNLKSRKNPAEIFNKLGQLLQDKGEWGYEVTKGKKIFDGFKNQLYQSITKNFGIDYILENLKIKSINDKNELYDDYTPKIKEILKEKYDIYFGEFKRLIQTHLPEGQQGMITIKNKLNILIADEYNEYKDDKIIPYALFADLPKLLAHICAIFTINGSKNYYNIDDTKFEDKNLLIPHQGQIVSIFEIFCLHTNKSEKLRNNLVQVGTGEGKSIILGLTSIIFALFGYEVSVACYSSHLSKRDYDSFLELFDFFGVTNFIHYGNFNFLLEKILNKDVNLKKYLNEIIFKKVDNNNQSLRFSKKFQILLFDEVDIFFSNDFYGKMYNSSLIYKHENVAKLFEFIWNKRNSLINLLLNLIKESDEYAKCKSLFGDWQNLLDEKLKDILKMICQILNHINIL